MLQVIPLVTMASNISAWLVPVLLAVACMALVINIFHARKVNTSLVDDITNAQADLQVAADNSHECIKKLGAKNAEMTAKNQQVASLTDNVNTRAGHNLKKASGIFPGVHISFPYIQKHP
jgi:hypothetical protein